VIGERIIVLFHLDGNGGPAQRLLKIARAEFSPGGVNEYPALIGPSGPPHLRSLPLLPFGSSFLAPSFPRGLRLFGEPRQGAGQSTGQAWRKAVPATQQQQYPEGTRGQWEPEREPQVPR
jgi:hypothetical protein